MGGDRLRPSGLHHPDCKPVNCQGYCIYPGFRSMEAGKNAGARSMGGKHLFAVWNLQLLHHQPLRVWVICLYFMGLNLSNLQIARELNLDEDSAHDMATQLREGILAKQPPVILSGEVEIDEVYVVAGHKGHPDAVKKRGGRDVGDV